MSSHRRNTSSGDNKANALEAMREALGTIEFGSIQLTVREGRVVQLDVKRKSRFKDG